MKEKKIQISVTQQYQIHKILNHINMKKKNNIKQIRFINFFFIIFCLLFKNTSAAYILDSIDN